MTRLLFLVMFLLLAACAGPGPDTQVTPAAGATLDPAEANALYADFPDCEPLPAATPFDPVDGMVELESSWIEDVSETGPLVSIRGLVEMTPIELRDALSARDDVELVYIEDEGYETEILLDSGTHRTFVKATIRCRTGSVFAQIIGPADDPGMLPVPGQQSGS